jgi:rubredoxin
MKTWKCKCGWVIAEQDYMKVNFDALCPRCGRRYSTFTAHYPLHIGGSRSVLGNRRPRAKRQSSR